jgi:hypothetical protein
MKRLAVALVLVAAGCGGSPEAPKRAAAPTVAPAEPVATAPCRPPRVNHTPYPGGDERMFGTPWIEGSPGEVELVGLLWYWPPEWQGVRRARVFTGGVAPAGYSAKVLWAFLSPSVGDRAGSELVIEAENLDGPGRWRDTFSAISYEGQEGAPSYASSIDLPRPGCWRLRLTTGSLRAFVDIRAVPPSAVTEPPCRPARVNHSAYPGGGVGDPTWIRGEPRSSGLAGVLGYWPRRWRDVDRARVRTGAKAKVMWAFLGPRAKNRGGDELLMLGRNLDGPGEIRETFPAVGYEGQNRAPSYSSHLTLPQPGCWRLALITAGLRATVDIRAVGR